MIARELDEFFAGFSPNGAPVVQGPADPHFLSNVNACYRRACWQEIRFADVDYAEDQAFGKALPRLPLAQGLPPGRGGAPRPRLRARRVHAALLRRVPRPARDHRPRGAASTCAAWSPRRRADERWMRERGWPLPRRAAWTARSAGHHVGRRVFAALGSRSERLPARLQRALSLERTAPSQSAARTVPPEHEDVLRVRREGPTALLDVRPGGVRAREPAFRLRRAAVRARQRRPRRDLHARGRPRAARPHLLDLGPRPGRQARPRGVGAAAPARARLVRADARAGHAGLRRAGTERTSWSPPAGRPSTRR